MFCVLEYPRTGFPSSNLLARLNSSMLYNAVDAKQTTTEFSFHGEMSDNK